MTLRPRSLAGGPAVKPTRRELTLAALASLCCITALVVMTEDQASTTATSPDPLSTVAHCAEDDP